MRVSQSGSNPVQGSEISQAGKAKAASKTEKPEGPAKAAEGAKTGGGESVKADISSRGKELAKDMAKAKEVATSAPDIREEKVAELKRRIAAGKYNVSPEAIADKMVDEHLKTADLG